MYEVEKIVTSRVSKGTFHMLMQARKSISSNGSAMTVTRTHGSLREI